MQLPIFNNGDGVFSQMQTRWASILNSVIAKVNGGTLVAPILTSFLLGSGTYTPPAGTVYLEVFLVGAGGGGSGSGNNDATNGANGGNTTFGQLTVGGGTGGTQGNGGLGGFGGTLVGTTPTGLSVFSFVGGRGGGLQQGGTTDAILFGGIGGNSILAGGDPQSEGGGAIGRDGTLNSGGGGSGGGGGGSGIGAAIYTGCGGGAGASIITILSGSFLLSSFSYSVGTGGIKGLSGTNGNNGGNGAAGRICLKAYA